MSCCMVSKHNLGDALEWIQHITLWVVIKVVSAAATNNVGPLLYGHSFAAAIKAAYIAVAAEHYGRVYPSEYSNLFQDHIIELIGEFTRSSVTCDPPYQEGGLCFKNTHALWAMCSKN